MLLRHLELAMTGTFAVCPSLKDGNPIRGTRWSSRARSKEAGLRVLATRSPVLCICRFMWLAKPDMQFWTLLCKNAAFRLRDGCLRYPDRDNFLESALRVQRNGTSLRPMMVSPSGPWMKSRKRATSGVGPVGVKR